MKKLLLTHLHIFILVLILPCASIAQPASTSGSLFSTDSTLQLTLRGNLGAVLNDRSEKTQYHPLLLLYKDENSNEIVLPVNVKTRGHFRKLRGNCTYPPLAVHFTKNDSLKYSLFKHQDKLKLVMPCAGDEYVLREWMVYRIYNLVTPNSFKTRLVKLTLENSNSKRSGSTMFGILLEDERQMAKRNNCITVSRKFQPDQTEPAAFLTMAVFQYLVGNTDWSVQYQQNIKLVAADSTITPIAVPYDFDHAGLVNAPYAKPADQLLMNSVRDRRYRGYCEGDMKKFDAAIALYNRLKKDIYRLYTTCRMLDEKYKKTTLQYLDEFYSTINDTVKMKKAFGYPCNKKGTGNVVIKGLKENQ